MKPLNNYILKIFQTVMHHLFYINSTNLSAD